MLNDRIEHRWLEAFRRVFSLCALNPGTKSRCSPNPVATPEPRTARPPWRASTSRYSRSSCRHRRRRHRCRFVRRREPGLAWPCGGPASPRPRDPGGRSDRGRPAARTTAPRPAAAGTRVLMIRTSIRTRSSDSCRSARTRPARAIKACRSATAMHVSSAAGTDLHIDLREARTGGVWGWCDKPGQVAHWPGGIVVNFPRPHSVNGRLVLDVGDINLTFKRYLEQRVTLVIETISSRPSKARDRRRAHAALPRCVGRS